MRVLFVTHNYPRFEGDLSGNFLHPLARALQGRGHEVRVIAPSDAGQGGTDLVEGVPVRRVRYADAAHETLAYRGTMASALGSPRGMHALAGMVRAFTNATREEIAGGTDTVVHAHWWFPAALAIPRGTPAVVTCHGTDLRLLDTSRLARFVGRRVLRRMTIVTTVSRFLADIVTRRTGRPVAADEVHPMPILQVARPLSEGGGGIVILGRLTPQKRLGLAFEGIADARARGVDVPVTVVGDGPERARLQMLVGALGLRAQVTFAGNVPAREVPGFLAHADACVMTARHEGLGLAAAEAMIQGVPTIACTDGGGLLDVVPRAGGGRVVAPTREAVATALVEITGNAGDRDAARLVGQRWAARLAPGQVAAACEGWYRRVADA
ncbi:MAG TPA: glycosyltransferase family 4 protein [Gemmatimonadales bacterium]|nr:glycosyltransferase family 4 protein [Gemmatimonadales bacterium]